MKKIEETIEIIRPLQGVFTFTTDADKWPKWQTFITESAHTSQGGLGVGSTFKGIVHMMGLNMKWTAEATEYTPEIKWAKNINSGGISIAEQMNYHPTEEGTEFKIVYDIEIHGFMKLFSPMIVRTMRKETIKSLSALKTILEART